MTFIPLTRCSETDTTRMLLALALAISVGHGLAVGDTTTNLQESSFSRLVKTTVINAYVNTTVNAFVFFEENDVNRLKYGESRSLDVVYKQHDDFIVQFKTEVIDRPVPELLDYGFLQEPATDNTEVILVITQQVNEKLPTHLFMAFRINSASEEFSKLYFLNTVSTALNVYALYQRPNVDGSYSESVTVLAQDVGQNTGRDIDLEPNIQLQIKVFTMTINSVDEFKNTKEIVLYRDYQSLPGKRQFMLVYGILNSTVTPPQSMLLGNIANNSAQIATSLTMAVLCVITTNIISILTN